MALSLPNGYKFDSKGGLFPVEDAYIDKTKNNNLLWLLIFGQIHYYLAPHYNKHLFSLILVTFLLKSFWYKHWLILLL